MRSLTVAGSISFVFALAAINGGCGDNKTQSQPDGGGTCSGSFVSPADLATLTEVADTTGSCADGFQTNITVATSQPEGTNIDLLIGGTKVATAKVAGAKVVFTAVQLAEGANMLKASVSATCALSATVTVNCNVPVCTITKPSISATHPKLNGVPAANGGDRASAPGAAYQAEFDVMTDIEDGQSVDLKVANTAVAGASTVYSAKAVGGKVVFAGITLVPDGDYSADATCTNKAGRVGHSTKGMFPVDSSSPVLTISSPADGKFFGPTELTGGAFKVCAKTTSADAVATGTTKNLSVAVGTASPDPTTGSVAVTAVDTDTCVNVACTSSSPVDLTVTLKDGAGNPTTKTISQIACATALAGVQIVSPPGDTAPFGDPSKHLLAANSTNALKDQDATKNGAQYTVVACSDKAGQATLLVGFAGGTSSPIAGPIATVAATAADGCSAGKTQVAKFVGATLPDSMVTPTDGTLAAATALEVDVKDSSTAVGKSPPVNLWVAASPPSIANSASAAICETNVASTVDVTKPTVTFVSSVPTVTLTVTGTGGAKTYQPATFAGGYVNFSNVLFALGTSTVTAVATDKAGNVSTLAQPCTVQVGTFPVVTFTAPAANLMLCAAGNASPTCVADMGAGAGWQGTLVVRVTVAGAPATSGTVTFTASSSTTSLGTANIDASGNATLTGVTIPDGNPVTITATTSAIGGTNSPGKATRIVVVDTTTPSAPAAFSVAIKDRRQTSFTLTWTAPSDGGATVPVAGYDIRYSQAPITAASFATATVLPTGGSPQSPGATETGDVTDLYIENDYYFAMAAKDAAGNVSPIISATPSGGCATPPCAIRAKFNQTFILGPQTSPDMNAPNYISGLGDYLDGSGNFVGDANSDILVGEDAGTRAYIFAGASNFANAAPAVTFQGPKFFGGSIGNIGDVDGDGLEDIAVSSAVEAPAQVYIFKGRATWPTAPLLSSMADYNISTDGSFDGAFLGYPIVKLGDINGDGVGDFGLAAAGGAGALVVVYGSKPFSGGALNTLVTAGKAKIFTGSASGDGFGTGATVLGASNGTLIVGAPFATNSAGRLQEYKWLTNDLVPIGMYDGAAGAQIGQVLTPLGDGTGLVAGNFASALVFFGGALSNPLAGTNITITNAAAPSAFVALSGGFSGSNQSFSFIGDSRPDVVVASNFTSTPPSTVYIIDGAQVATLGATADVGTAAKVKLTLPADWRNSTIYSSSVKDINGDGYGDFAIGETDDFLFTVPFQGRVAVFW